MLSCEVGGVKSVKDVKDPILMELFALFCCIPLGTNCHVSQLKCHPHISHYRVYFTELPNIGLTVHNIWPGEPSQAYTFDQNRTD